MNRQSLQLAVRLLLLWGLTLSTGCSGCGEKEPGTYIVPSTDMGMEDMTPEVDMPVDMTPPKKSVAKVEVSPTELMLQEGDRAQLSWKLLDDEGNELQDRIIFWSSDNQTVATVTNAGEVTAATIGSAVLTLSAEGVKATVDVTVSERTVAKVTLAPESASIKPGEQLQMMAAALDKDDDELPGAQIRYTSSQPTIATVNPSGLVVGGEPGMTIITAESQGLKATAVITVDDRSVGRVEIAQDPLSVQVGALEQARVRVYSEDNRELMDRTVTWTMMDPTIATVDASGRVSGKLVGETMLTAEVEGKTDTVKVVVVPEPVDSVLVRPDMTTISPGETVQLIATALGATGNTLSGRAFSWSSSSPTIASVDANGLVSGLAIGITTIEAVSENVRATAQVRVLPAVDSVDVTPAMATAIVGTEVQLSGTPRDAQGNPLVRSITWMTSDAALAIVDINGKVSTQQVGTVTITATAGNGSGTAVIQIIPEPVDSVTLSPDVTVLTTGATTQLTATAKDQHGNVVTGRMAQWMTSDASVATVDANGQVTGGSQGRATITVTIEGKTATADIVVPRGFKAVETGGSHTCGIATDDTSYCWGRNNMGALGVGQSTSQLSESSTPLAISGTQTLASMDSRSLHTCGLTALNELYCWGWNVSGQYGNGTTFSSNMPVKISTSNTYTSIAVGGSHTCGRTAAGAVHCWGDNVYGQVGDGTNTQRTSPRAVTGTYSMMTTGGTHVCAVNSADNKVYCWGRNNSGQLGDNSFVDRNAPVAVSTTETFASVYAGSSHTCALTSAGAAYCWGDNSDGQLGDNSMMMSTTPVAVLGGHTFASLSLGSYHTCGITTGGQTYCWGANNNGQLGDGTKLGATQPVQVSGGYTFTSLSLGSYHTCGITDAQVALCWGYNFNGQLGEGTTTDRTSPYPIVVP